MSRKILIIDPNAAYGRLFEILFQGSQLEVTIARTATSGLEHFFTPPEPDLVVIDLMVSDMDIFQACDIMKQSPQGAQIPVILTSPVFKKENFRAGKIKEFGLHDFLLKPFDLVEFLKILDAALGTQEHERLLSAKQDTDKIPVEDKIEGDLGIKISFAQLLHKIYRKKLTGKLELSDDDVHKFILFCDGAPVYAFSSDTNESICNSLLKKGRITEEQIKTIETEVKEEGTSESEALVTHGIINSVDLHHEEKELVVKKIAHCYRWRHGSYQFFFGVAFFEKAPVFDLDPLTTFLACVQGAVSPYEIERKLREYPDNALIGLTGDLDQAWYELDMTSEARTFLDSVKDKITIDETFELLEKDHNTAHLIAILLDFRILDIQKPVAKRQKSKKKTASSQLQDMILAAREKESERAKDPGSKTEDGAFMIEEEDNVSSLIADALAAVENKKTEAVLAASEIDVSVETPELFDDDTGSDATDQQEEPEEEEKKLTPEEFLAVYGSMMDMNYFELLGMDSEIFTTSELTKAYFKSARTYHHDLLGEESSDDVREKAENLFKRIKAAYKTLSDDAKLERYNEWRENPRGNFEDILDEMLAKEAEIEQQQQQPLPQSPPSQKPHVKPKPVDMKGENETAPVELEDPVELQDEVSEDILDTGEEVHELSSEIEMEDDGLIERYGEDPDDEDEMDNGWSPSEDGEFELELSGDSSDDDDDGPSYATNEDGDIELERFGEDDAPEEASENLDPDLMPPLELEDMESEIPDAPPEKSPAEQAVEAFQKGNENLKMQLFQDAVQSFQQAQALNPDELKYRVWEGWAQYHIARVNKDKFAKKDAAQIILSALKKDRKLERGYFFLGKIFLIEKNLEKAERYFNSALKYNSGATDTREALQAIEKYRQSKD